MAGCIDLRAKYGGVYVDISCEESCRSRSHGEQCDPWLAIIVGVYGHVYPHGGRLLGVSTNSRRNAASQIASLKYTKVLHDGSDGINAVFPEERLDEIGKIIGLRKMRGRRKLSPGHRNVIVQAGINYRF